MNEWLKKVTDSAKEFWKKTSIIQKVILFGVIAAIIVAIATTVAVSSRPTGVRLFNSPVTDITQRTRILDRLSQENVSATVSSDGYITLSDEVTARRMRTIVMSEGLTPANIDPFASFYERSWSTTDADQNVKRKQAIQEQLRQHIETIEEISSANVNIVLPENRLFSSEQNPVTASVLIRVMPNSNLLSDTRRIRGIQNVIKMAVEGLTDENITIADAITGETLNDFAGMAEMDRISRVSRQQREIQKLETYYRARILGALQSTLTEDRVRDLNIKIDMNMSQRTSQSTIYTPITIRPDNPDTPYDDSEFRDTLPISQQTVTKEWQGTGFNPEGPAGVEGQTPPVYSDMSNVIGRSVETGVTQNNVINTTTTQEEVSPTIDRVTVSVNVDGSWRTMLDPETHKPLVDEETGGLQRVYTPVPREQLEQLASYVQDAIGYDRSRNYSVTVTNIQYDRGDQFAAEDAAYFSQQQRKLTVLLSLASVALILIGFIIFRIITRELERRKRLREAEELRKQQEARERALWEAREQGVEVTMSVEESRRQELQENAIAMAKEHPEEVAMLLRTWLMEEG